MPDRSLCCRGQRRRMAASPSASPRAIASRAALRTAPQKTALTRAHRSRRALPAPLREAALQPCFEQRQSCLACRLFRSLLRVSHMCQLQLQLTDAALSGLRGRVHLACAQRLSLQAPCRSWMSTRQVTLWRSRRTPRPPRTGNRSAALASSSPVALCKPAWSGHRAVVQAVAAQEASVSRRPLPSIS